MQYIRNKVGFLLAAIFAAIVAGGCGQLTSLGNSTAIRNDTWPRQIDARRAKIDAVISENRESFEAFDQGSLGDTTLEMIPYVIFRVFQELEPAVLGNSALAEVGFFAREEIASGRHGITWTRPTSVDGRGEIRYMTRSCASCHTGRVRLSDGSVRILNGAVNGEMNAHLFNGRLMNLLKDRLGDSNDSMEYQNFKRRVARKLDEMPHDWFWGLTPKTVSPHEAAREVRLIAANLDAILEGIRAANNNRLNGLRLLSKYTYSKFKNSPSLAGGAPGLVETSGLGSAALGLKLEKKIDDLTIIFPPGPAKADISAVWQIDPSGYANWDGTLKGFARSMTSSLAVVVNGDKIDLKKNVLIQNFLPKLPAEPYPFVIDTDAIPRGEATFKQNCVGCHEKSGNRNRNSLVFDVGTDLLRANAITSQAAKLMSQAIRQFCPEKQSECHFNDGEVVVDPSGKRGYVAGSLVGIWAQAPYLHNGSVPTLRHLLIPKLRSDAPFLRGSISYDQRNGGWEWDPKKKNDLIKKGEPAVALHDTREAGLSNVGHGFTSNQYVVDGRGKEVRIAWDDTKSDQAVVNDLIAYLLSL